MHAHGIRNDHREYLRACCMNFKVICCPHFIFPTSAISFMSIITSIQWLYNTSYFHSCPLT